MKRLAFRSLTVASLLLGSSVVVGAGQAHAQWTNSPEPTPMDCTSWQTQFAGGMCRMEHFNGSASGLPSAGPNMALPPGTGLTGISPGSNTNSPTISRSESSGGSSTSSGGSAGSSGSSGGAGAGGAGGAGSSGGAGGSGGSGGSGGAGGGGSSGPY